MIRPFVFAAAGYDLLKKKSDALTFRFREITRKIKESKDAMGEQMRATIFSLTEAVWAGGDFKCEFQRFPAGLWLTCPSYLCDCRKKVTEAPKMTASIRVNIRYDNVAGVRLPVFTTVRALLVCIRICIYLRVLYALGK